MALTTDEFRFKKLKDNNIDVETTYLVNKDLIIKKNNDYENDDIKDAIIYNKKYYLNKKLVKEESNFDSRIKYSFIAKNILDDEYTCLNCGMKANKKDFINGCPYCRTIYNVDYEDKSIAGKYYYDFVLHNNIYRIITLVVDFIVSFFLYYIIIKNTSRTFNNFDIYKIIIYSIIVALILYYLFYIIDAYIVLLPIKLYKNNKNEKQKIFWQETKLDKKAFFNNFNYELSKFYYKTKDIIDFDVLDYDDFNYYEENNDSYIIVKVFLRVMYLDNNKIKSKYLNKKFTFIKNKNFVNTENNKMLIKCHNCGSSININDGICKYCHTKIKYYQTWMLITN